jgi:glycosyltransferase involved in cell wall biosynthesis
MAWRAEDLLHMSTRVALHLPGLDAGGVEKTCLILAREFVQLGFDVDLVVLRVEGALACEVPSGVRVIHLNARRTRNGLLPLARYLRRERPDMLIANLGAQNVSAILARFLARVPTRIVAVQHNALTRQAQGNGWLLRLLPLIYRLLLPFADRIVCVSHGVADDIARATGISRTAITVIHNPVEAPDGNHPPRNAEKFFCAGFPVAVAVGRLVHQKGFDTLIRAVALANRTTPLGLAIVGDGLLRQELVALAQREGIADRVYFAGFQLQPAAFIRHARMLVLSSRHEGFGTVLVEALACGVPVVSTDCDYGPSEILRGGALGRLVAVDDAAALAEAMIATLGDHQDRGALIGRAADFAPARIARSYVAMWQAP